MSNNLITDCKSVIANPILAAKTIRDLQTENAALRSIATRLIQNNGGPLQSDEAVECDRQDDYLMVKVQDFEALCAAIDAAREEAQP